MTADVNMPAVGERYKVRSVATSRELAGGGIP
jgi:hypothetical protein